MSLEAGSEKIDGRVAQFEKTHVKQRRIGGVETSFVDAAPVEPTEKYPILVAPGYGATIRTNAAMLEFFHRQGTTCLPLTTLALATRQP